MRDAAQRLIVTSAVRQLEADLDALSPFLAPRVRAWMGRLSGGAAPADYFLHLRAFPFVQIPWWFEASLGGDVDPALHEALAGSSIAGYYFIRILDGLMDGHATDEISFLPALGVLHERFQAPYVALFAAAHPFWRRFREVWAGCLDVTARDAAEGAPTLDDFLAVTARKVDAASLPLAAVALRLGREDALAPWLHVFTRLGRWHLLEEDLLDIAEDAGRGGRTFVLSEAERRRAPHQSALGWLLAGGIGDLHALLRRWMIELRESAAGLGSPGLLAYLDEREGELAHRVAAMQPGLRALTRVAAAIEGIR
jgi:hypothetical protein